MAGAPRLGAARLAAFLTLATIAQLAFWRLSTPGPVLLDGAARGPGYAATAVVWSALTLLAAALISAPVLGTSVGALGLRWGRSGRGLLLAAALAAVAVPLVASRGADPALSDAYPWISAAWLERGAGRWILWGAAYAVYYLAYEAFYRGAVLQALRARLGDGPANVAQAMLATLVHVGKPLSETVAAFPASLAFGWLALRSRSIVPPLALHLAIGLAMDASVVARSAG